jgi:hypothetical protein
LEDFMSSYHDFRESQRGRTLIALAGRALADMAALSNRGEPAVAAIDSAVAEALGPLNSTERQHGGRIVRDELARIGLRPQPVRKRLRGGRAFTSGAVYAGIGAAADLRPDPPDAPAKSWEERSLARADEAIAMLASARTGNAGSVDDFIAERRAEARHEEA